MFRFVENQAISSCKTPLSVHCTRTSHHPLILPLYLTLEYLLIWKTKMNYCYFCWNPFKIATFVSPCPAPKLPPKKCFSLKVFHMNQTFLFHFFNSTWKFYTKFYMKFYMKTARKKSPLFLRSTKFNIIVAENKEMSASQLRVGQVRRRRKFFVPFEQP